PGPSGPPLSRPAAVRETGPAGGLGDIQAGRGQLAGPHAAVRPVGGDELLVRAELHDPAALEDADVGAVPHGGEPVGDDDGGAALHQAAEGILDEAFRL